MIDGRRITTGRSPRSRRIEALAHRLRVGVGVVPAALARALHSRLDERLAEVVVASPPRPRPASARRDSPRRRRARGNAAPASEAASADDRADLRLESTRSPRRDPPAAAGRAPRRALDDLLGRRARSGCRKRSTSRSGRRPGRRRSVFAKERSRRGPSVLRASAWSIRSSKTTVAALLIDHVHFFDEAGAVLRGECRGREATGRPRRRGVSRA